MLGVSGAYQRWSGASAAPSAAGLADDRAYWVETLTRIAAPVLENLAAGTLRANMPVEHKPGSGQDRAGVTHLEAFGRTMAGIAPWLALGEGDGEEARLRARFIDLSLNGLANAVSRESPDAMNFTQGGQPLVDAAFLAHAILRAPDILWERSEQTVREQLVHALMSTRRITPAYSNWLLFTAMVEAALLKVGADWDAVRVDLALRKMQEWYVGDGHFSDGPEFHWDYYNSFVIQPFMLDILQTVQDKQQRYADMLARQLQISKRYGEIQERLICPDGTFPAIGRSITYRFGAFQLLAQLALMQELPASLSPAQVRSALTAVIRRVLQASDLFDSQGWLRLGLYGAQPDLAEGYISTGSLYLNTVVFLPLGLPPDHPFWALPAADWTSKRIWAGEPLPADSALRLPPS
jgi:hypothetical protein